VNYWFSPFPISPALEANLMASGLKRSRTSTLAELPPESLLIYLSPHELLDGFRNSNPWPLTLSQIVKSYHLLSLEASRHHLVASWRLSQLEPHLITAWAASVKKSINSMGLEVKLPQVSPDRPSSLLAVVTNAVLQRYPDMLEAYLLLDRQSDRLGGLADQYYSSRLEQAIELRSLWLQWQQTGDADDLLVQQLLDAHQDNLSLFRVQQRQQRVIHALGVHCRKTLSLLQHQWALISRAACR
jgi:hypothetical protein